MFVLALTVQAQDASFTYQGILKQDGFAAYGTYDFQFDLYQFDTGGTPLGPSNLRSAVNVSNGLFTVPLDFGSGVFNADSRWLQISVKTNASPSPHAVLTPRQELTPTPHAVYAHNALRANAVPWSGVESLPGGFADGVDNDTTYAAGTGLTLSGTTFSLDTALMDARYWRLGGNNVVPGQFLGTTNDQPLEFRAFQVRALRLEPANGRPNIIGGSPMNLVFGPLNSATIGGGHFNILSNVAHSSTIAGGSNNAAGGYASFIGGGIANEAQGTNATVAGGAFNKAWGHYGTVGGGLDNQSEAGATVAGGRGNRADGPDSTIGGGFVNRASGYISTVSGGQGNTARGVNSVVAGGASNDIGDLADNSTIGGGVANDVGRRSRYGVIAGGFWNVVSNDFSTVGGGGTNQALAYGSVIAGGSQNSARATNATVAGGHRNIAWGEHSTIGGGLRNEALYNLATVSGGASNLASAPGSVIAGGINHSAEGPYSTIGGGQSNRVDTGFLADGRGATIGGGAFNYISEFGLHGTIPGGYSNTVLFPYGFAAGYRAKANHSGSFVWADRTENDFASTTDNQFAVRANNGVMIQSAETALDLRGGGAMRVQGAGVGSSTPVFIHRATAANTLGNVTTIDHPHSNGQPNAILIVTPNYNPGGVGGTYNNSPIGVYYSAGKWTIFNQTTTTSISIGAAFNVMVVKP
jgi:hypothetical protein